MRELGPQMYLDIVDVKRLEGAVVRLLKEDGNGHDLAGMHPRGSSSSPRPRRQQLALPGGSKVLPELVHRTVHFEYTHGSTSRVGMFPAVLVTCRSTRWRPLAGLRFE